MPYLSPFDNVLNAWFTLEPVYAWEPVPPEATPPGTENACPESGETPPRTGASNADDAQTASLEWVFKGLQLVIVPVWNEHVNPQYELIREADEHQDDEAETARRTAAARRPPPVAAHDDTPPAADAATDAD